MDRRALILLAWRIGLLARRVPLAALCGAVCLAGAAALWLQALHLEARRDAVLAQARSPERPAPQPVGDGVAAALEAFYASLPEGTDAAVAVRKLFDVAAGHGLQLERGEYRVVRDPRARVARYQIVLPVKGEPRAVQDFIVDALNGMRMLTLDSVSFRRERAAATQIESRIQFSVVGRLE